jgi:hypothetical protein
MNPGIYIVIIDGWMMPFNHKPKKEDFRKDARLFYTDCDSLIDFLPDWFGRGFNHPRFTEITNSWD